MQPLPPSFLQNLARGRDDCGPDMRRYVVDAWGPWLRNTNAFTQRMFRLSDPRDGVTLTGPVRVNVALHVLNEVAALGSRGGRRMSSVVERYVLDIPAAHSWTYGAPRGDARSEVGVWRDEGGELINVNELRIELPTPSTVAPVEPTPDDAGAAVAATRLTEIRGGKYQRPAWPSSNGGYEVRLMLEQPELVDECAADLDPCGKPKPRASSCGCGDPQCKSGGTSGLPCDYAVRPGTASDFFPVTCEPCEVRGPVCSPQLKGPSLPVPPAKGGPVRTRYFNGMHIAKEDLETDANNVRLKRSLMNRAMGQGVVWGLVPRFDGTAICISPGYGVDCCGQDLVLACAYNVEVAGLLRDPAIRGLLAKGEPAKVHLLLEYVECPEAPRPVHGDACASTAPGCEMSRVRETVRLRLVPPREHKPAKALQDFIDAATKLARADRGPGTEGAEDLETLYEREREAVVRARAPGPQPVGSTNENPDRPNENPDRPNENPERPNETRRPPYPCTTDCCDPRHPPRFKDLVVDVRSLMAAAVYAVLAAEMEHDRRGGATTPSPRAQVLWLVYMAIARGLLGGQAQHRADELLEALKRLWEAWCRALLYAGPTCDAEPHGVVIGCAMLDRCDVQHVDPWGGRRWVMHYPLVTHWASQFGVPPVDVVLSRIFSMVCCISNLPVPDLLGRRRVDDADARSNHMAFDAGVLLTGTPADLEAQERELGLGSVERMTVAPAEFGTRVAASVRGEGAGFTRGRRPIRYEVMGVQGVAFVAFPDGSDRKGDDPAGRPNRDVPALLRGAAARIASDWREHARLPRTNDDQRKTAATLERGGVHTIGQLLSADPEELDAKLFGAEDAESFERYWLTAERSLDQLSDAAAEAMREAARKGARRASELRAMAPELAASVTAKLPWLVESLGDELESSFKRV